jgi:hypothetical protein
MPVQLDAAGVEQDRAGDPFTDCLVDGAADRGWERDKDALAAFAEDPEDAVAVFLAEVGDVQAGGFEDAQASSPSRQTSAKSKRLADSRAAVSSASSWRCVRRRVSGARPARAAGGRARPANARSARR